MIGRFLASWAIWMSVFGLVCCDAGIERFLSRNYLVLRPARARPKAGESCCHLETRCLRPGEFAGAPTASLRAVPARPWTRVTLMRPSGQTTVKPSASTATTSPYLPPMPLGSLAGQRRRRRRPAASCRRASSRRRAPDCSRGSAGRSGATTCPSRCGRCRRWRGLRRWPWLRSCLMRGALPAFTRSTDSSIASTPIGNRRSK